MGLTLWAAAAARAEPVQVVASFSILADLVQIVGGPAVTTTTLVKAGADPHVFEPRPADVRKLASARVVFVNGLGFEGWLNRLVRSSGAEARLVVVSAGLTASESPAPGRAGARDLQLGNPDTAGDPHAWHSVANAAHYVRNIRTALCAASPASCSGITARADAYLAELDRLERSIRAAIRALPPGRRTVITGHRAFSHFATAYGIRFVSPRLGGAQTHASPQIMAGLIKLIEAEQINALFLEKVSDPRLVQQISRETGLEPSGTLYSDTLGPAGSGADSYVGMMRHNVETLIFGLSRP